MKEGENGKTSEDWLAATLVLEEGTLR